MDKRNDKRKAEEFRGFVRVILDLMNFIRIEMIDFRGPSLKTVSPCTHHDLMAYQLFEVRRQIEQITMCENQGYHLVY